MRPLFSCNCLIAAIATFAQHPFTTNPPNAYKLIMGPYEVGISDADIQDGKRDKPLPIRIYFPKASAKFPVIFFSHGFGASREHYGAILRHWASYGYFVIAPTHSDSFSLRGSTQDPFDLRVLQNRRDNDIRLVEDRVADFKLLLEMLPALSGMASEFRGGLDSDAIAVSGHSLGAHTAQLLAGAETSQGRRKMTTLGDSRIKAVLLFSAPGRGQFGLTDTSWAKVKIPLMAMTGSEDFFGRGQGAGVRIDPFSLSAPNGKYGVYIEGANHLSFVGNPEIAQRVGNWRGLRRRDPGTEAPDQKAIMDCVRIASIAFWDSVLKQTEKARKYLDSEDLPTFSKGILNLSRR